MPRLLLILLVLLALWWLLSHFNRLPAAERKKFAFNVFIGLLLLVVIGLAMTGRLHWLFAAIAAVVSFLPRMLAWLVRTWPALQFLHGRWRQSQQQQTPPGHGASRPNTGPMTAQEAREILGVKPQATTSEIIEAHRRLIQKLHPDRGGSDYLAAKINQAKDVLLQEGKNR